MQRSRYDGANIRQVLAAMVTDTTVLGRIAGQWTDFGLFQSKYANIVGKWCVEYFKKYGSAPNGQIKSLFQEWEEKYFNDTETVDLIEKFLRFTSDEHQSADEQSSDFYIDLAEKLFNKVRLEADIEQATIELERGLVEDAQTTILDSRPIELSLGSYLEPANDFKLWEEAFSTERRKPLVTYSGALGKFFGDAFVKGELYAFMGPDKCYKTGWLIDLTYKAIRKGNRVAFFDVGDSNEFEFITRLACRASGQPDHSCETDIPIKWNGNSLFVETINYNALDPIDGFRSFKKVSKSPDALRISCYPNSSVTVEEIDNVLEKWERDSWIPNIIVIDYADILASPNHIKDKLDKIDMIWKSLRRLSQERNCLVLTATQSSAAAYGKEKGLLGKQHFSGRKTKLAEVNGMFGINVSDDERLRGEARLNEVVRRKSKNRKDKRLFVTVAGCYDIENPAIISK